MPDNSILVTVSAVSGLTGALGAQIINSVNAYFIDKRKQTIEVNNEYRAKKVEIGESFYYITGEKMSAIKKNIRYWKNWHNSRSEKTLAFLKKEMLKLNTDIERLETDNWKYNLINLYFDITLTTDEVLYLNAQTHQQYLKVLDITDNIIKANEPKPEALYQAYAIAIFDLCSLYEDTYHKMEQDMATVRKALLEEFSV